MSPLRRLVSVAVLGVAALAPLAAQQETPFRASVDAVTVDVSVQRGGRPVSGLQVSDFTLTDNGVAQTIAGMTYERLPIDVTVLLDVSGSVSGAVMDMLRRSIADLQRDLQPADRLRLVAFNMRAQRLLAAGGTGTSLDGAFAALTPGGSSAVLDALVIALTSRVQPDHRHLVVLFSDGKDNASVSTPELLLDVARRTTPTVSVVLATPLREMPTGVYADLANETGGSVTPLMSNERLGDSLRRALDQFRSSYVLTFSPAGVSRAGDHLLDVRVSRQGVQVRARRGYSIH